MRKTRILSLLTGVLMTTVSILSLFSCIRKLPDGEIVGASLSSNAMPYPDCYFFSLSEREDGVLLFSCDEDDGEGRVTFEDRPAPQALLREFRRAAYDTRLDRSVAAGKRAHDFGALDKTTWHFTVTWSDGTTRTTSVRPEGEAEIRAFLSKAARTLAITEEDAGPLTDLSLSASASWIEGSYSFSVTERKGEFLFDAQFTELLPAGEGWDTREIKIEDAVLSAEQMQRIRDAVREIALWERLAAAEIEWEAPGEDGGENIPFDATTYSVSARWGNVCRGDRGWGDPDYGALMTVLRETAHECEP